MKKNTKNLLCAVIPVAVATQLLSIVCFRHTLTIGGEILIPALILLIKHLITEIISIFAEIKEYNVEENKMNYPKKYHRILLKKYGLNPRKWLVTAESSTSITVANRQSSIVCVLDKKRGADSE